MIAAAVCAFLANVLLPIPVDKGQVIRTGIFLTSSLIISVVGERQVSARNALARANAELQKKQETLELALGAGQGFAWFWDAKTDSIIASTVVDPVPRISFRMRSEDWPQHVFSSDKAKVRVAVKNAIDSGENYRVEYRLAQDESRWVSSVGHVMRSSSNELTGIVGVTLDITEAKKTEEALRKSEQLATAGRLAATLAHEVNNPLEAVVNLVFLAQQEPELPDQCKQYMKMAGQELERVVEICRNSLAFHKNTSSRIDVNLAQAVQDVLRVYERKLSDKSLTVSVSDGADNASAHVFPGDVKQILANLITNAVEAADQGGRVIVRVRRHESALGPISTIVFADNGCGVPVELRQRLFEPFVTSKPEGTGLGLWVTRELVTRNGGWIKLRTSTHPSRHGTVFSISFPARQSAEASA
jgi:signal transduction histidine kinase